MFRQFRDWIRDSVTQSGILGTTAQIVFALSLGAVFLAVLYVGLKALLFDSDPILHTGAIVLFAVIATAFVGWGVASMVRQILINLKPPLGPPNPPGGIPLGPTTALPPASTKDFIDAPKVRELPPQNQEGE
jgi:amino acid transporter